MIGYKIGFSEIADGKDLALAWIKLEIPLCYPGRELIGSPYSYRSNIARVLSIRKIDKWEDLRKSGTITLCHTELDSAFSIYNKNFFYHPGEIVFPDKFDADYNKTCTNGIHFYVSQSKAMFYILNKWVQTQYKLYLYEAHKGLLRS